MTYTTHTQGPWWRDDDGFIAAGSGETYVTIADGDCSDLDIDEREANKRLIAAAPDLLAALEAVDAYLAPDGDGEDPYNYIRAVIKGAISKAQGA